MEVHPRLSAWLCSWNICRNSKTDHRYQRQSQMLRFLTVHYCRYHTCCTFPRGGKRQISFSQQGAMYSPNFWLGIHKKIIFCRKLQQNSPWSQWSESRPKLDVSPALLVGKMTSPFFTAGICLCFAVYVDCNDKAPRLCFRKPGVEVWTKRKNNSFGLQGHQCWTSANAQVMHRCGVLMSEDMFLWSVSLLI